MAKKKAKKSVKKAAKPAAKSKKLATGGFLNFFLYLLVIDGILGIISLILEYSIDKASSLYLGFGSLAFIFTVVFLLLSIIALIMFIVEKRHGLYIFAPAYVLVVTIVMVVISMLLVGGVADPLAFEIPGWYNIIAVVFSLGELYIGYRGLKM